MDQNRRNRERRGRERKKQDPEKTEPFPTTCPWKMGFPGRRDVGALPEFSPSAEPGTTQEFSEACRPGPGPVLLCSSLRCGAPALACQGQRAQGHWDSGALRAFGEQTWVTQCFPHLPDHRNSLRSSRSGSRRAHCGKCRPGFIARALEVGGPVTFLTLRLESKHFVHQSLHFFICRGGGSCRCLCMVRKIPRN